MKQLIVLISCVLLGIALVSMIVGPHEGSVYSALKKSWSSELSYRTLKGVE